MSKTSIKVLYEELRLLTKDTFEAIYRLKKICTNNSTHYILINDHIGDMIISLGYLNAFRNSKEKNHITLVVTEKYKELVSGYYGDYEDVNYIDSHYLYRIFLLNLTRFGEFYLKKMYPNVTFVNPADSVLLGFDYLKLYPEMNLEKMIKYGCFGLSNNAKFEPLSDEKYIDIHNKSRSVLLSVESRTVEAGQIELFEKLVQELEESGFEVYTNIADEEKCFGNSKPFYGSLSEIRKLLHGGVLIGVRSGLHDLAMYEKCKVVAIYPEDNKFGALFKLDMLPKTSAAYLEINQSKNLDNDCEAILGFIEE